MINHKNGAKSNVPVCVLMMSAGNLFEKNREGVMVIFSRNLTMGLSGLAVARTKIP
jgi:hypothetical protein